MPLRVSAICYDVLSTNINMNACTVKSTPVRVSLDSVQRNEDGSTKEDAVTTYLKALLVGKVVRNYPVSDFVRAVYGMTKEELKNKNPNGVYQLPKNWCRQYIQGSYSKNGTERSAYQPFFEIFDALRKQLAKTKPGGMNSMSLVNMNDREVKGYYEDLPIVVYLEECILLYNIRSRRFIYTSKIDWLKLHGLLLGRIVQHPITVPPVETAVEIVAWRHPHLSLLIASDMSSVSSS